MARKNFKAKNYVARPNPVASAMITTRAFNTRKWVGKTRAYNRTAERRNTRKACDGLAGTQREVA